MMQNEKSAQVETDSCPSEATLLAYSQGRLADDAIDCVTIHLEDCEACEKTLDRLEKVPNSLSPLMKRSPDFVNSALEIFPEPLLRKRVGMACYAYAFAMLGHTLTVGVSGRTYVKRFVDLGLLGNTWPFVATLVLLALGKMVRRGFFVGVPKLRLCELMVLGICISRLGWLQYANLDSLLNPVENFPLAHYVMMALGTVPHWILLTASYTVLIPNKPKRAALIIGVLFIIQFGFTIYKVFDPIFSSEARLMILRSIITIALFGGVISVMVARETFNLRRDAAVWQNSLRYRLIHPLGSGGMGEVWLVEDRQNKKRFALKFMHRHLASDVKSLRRFEREIRVTAGLSHPNIITIHDYGMSDDGNFYYVMEYVDGKNLEEVIREQGPLSPERAVRVLKQLAAALHVAHAAGRIHRDIKPSNLLMMDHTVDQVKVADFGLAGRIKFSASTIDITAASHIPGTPGFVAPEVLTGGTADAKSDLYGAGALGYFILTGKLPFSGPTAVQTILAQVRDEVVPPTELNPDIPSSLETIILRCLSRNPTERFPNAADLESALAEVEEHAMSAA